MSRPLERIEELDVSLFEKIHSQTSAAEKRSLLAVQRTTAAGHGEYVYLEIGSHLGGSIQPHLVDPRCKKIYSIDPRPCEQPDDRSSGYVVEYEDNSTERMLRLLAEIDAGGISKIESFEKNAPDVDAGEVEAAPELAFIDGEHTKEAALADFGFCYKVISGKGTILFHDFRIIYPAIYEICRELKKEGREFLPLLLNDNVFGIFFDPERVHSDPYLSKLYGRNKRFLVLFRIEQGLKRVLPGAVVDFLRGVYRRVRGS